MRVPSERQRVAKRSRARKHTTTTTVTTVPTNTSANAPASALTRMFVYLPPELIRRIKLAAVDRDEEISRSTRESNDESGIVAIRGMSGVVAQVMTGHFGLADMLADTLESKESNNNA